MRNIVLVLTLFLAAINANLAYAYDRVHVKNYSMVSGTVEVTYGGQSKLFKSCMPDKFHIGAAKVIKNGIQPSRAWPSDSRGSCLVDRITFHPNGHKISEVNDYRSSGTAKSEFNIMVRTPTRLRIMSNSEVAHEQKNTGEMSPGFKIHNRTNIPLKISLDQIGCLYYGTTQPGATFERNTGAVWFTITASPAPESESRFVGDLKCVLPAAKFAYDVLSFGSGWASQELVAKFIATQAVTRALTPIIMQKAGMIGVQKAGQYAGPPWPFRCTHKPEYEITGGQTIIPNKAMCDKLYADEKKASDQRIAELEKTSTMLKINLTKMGHHRPGHVMGAYLSKSGQVEEAKGVKKWKAWGGQHAKLTGQINNIHAKIIAENRTMTDFYKFTQSKSCGTMDFKPFKITKLNSCGN